MDTKVATEQEQKIKNNCPGYGNRPTFHEKTKGKTQIWLGGQSRTIQTFVFENTTGPNAPEQTKTACLSPG